ncbi:hypothetical protein HYH03_011585 [Edaphochlamys debaryana]|uniref:CHRD domain-containing protein n=1 Tax=Edaphochlamys debaryana TaxID=47281 RepID=A0A836BV07_9CHLO|nr:hypothetical protein HYH03_011585 [Edaphochlamys debaryana]|eukprot:KAG2489955.1 hypothetical protein HYH03_011585 [Edaphochlamys debaryana]
MASSRAISMGTAVAILILVGVNVAYADDDKADKVAVPAGSIVAYARLGPAPDKKSAGRGSVQLIIPPPGMGDSTVVISLAGCLEKLIMMHIHERIPPAAGGPVRVDLLPRIPLAAPATLQRYAPPLNYCGTLEGMTNFNDLDVAKWNTAAPSFDNFLAKLRAGLLYANVHTVANPGGEIQGFFECEAPCAWPMRPM